MSDRLPRHDFLVASLAATIGVGGAAATTASPACAAPPATTASAAYDDAVPFAFDRAAFDAILARPAAHRQVAAATTFASAVSALHFLNASLAAYADPNGFAAAPGALRVATVLYGGPSPLIAIDDAMWAQYPFAEMIRKFAKPPVVATPDAPLPPLARTNEHRAATIALARDHGASFFVCNNALSGLAATCAKGLDPHAADPPREKVVAIHAAFTANLLPGAMLVPAGVAALNAVQEARYTLIPANA